MLAPLPSQWAGNGCVALKSNLYISLELMKMSSGLSVLKVPVPGLYGTTVACKVPWGYRRAYEFVFSVYKPKRWTDLERTGARFSLQMNWLVNNGMR